MVSDKQQYKWLKEHLEREGVTEEEFLQPGVEGITKAIDEHVAKEAQLRFEDMACPGHRSGEGERCVYCKREARAEAFEEAADYFAATRNYGIGDVIRWLEAKAKEARKGEA